MVNTQAIRFEGATTTRIMTLSIRRLSIMGTNVILSIRILSVICINMTLSIA